MNLLRRLVSSWDGKTRGRLHSSAVRAADDKASLAQNRLYSAINALPEGIVLLDAEGRYILWNNKYAEIYHRSADLFQPGARLEDTLKVGVARGDYPDAIGREEEWLRDRLGLLSNPGVRHEQWLSDGRCIMIEERQTSDGGTVGLRVDITDMKRREESVRLLFESNPVPMFLYDSVGCVLVSANAAAALHFGYDAAQLPGLPAKNLFTPDDWHDARRALSGGLPHSDHIWRQVHRDGRELESILFTRQLDFDGRPSVLVSIFDVTERRRAEAKVAHMARHDELTGLPNRVHCREALNEMLAEARLAERSVAILMLDLDHFKAVNDTLGHSVGDSLLFSAAERIRELAGPEAFVARIGGDEFVVLVPLERNSEGALVIAERLVSGMAGAFSIYDQLITIGATIGIAMAPDDGDDHESLLKYADLALYSAKLAGRSGWSVFSPDMDIAAQQRRRLESDLRRAVREGELAVHYQQLVDLQSGEIVGYEALLRWHHPERGLVYPDEFIPLAEEIGLIDVIGQHVLQTACRDATQWAPGTKVAVNLSPVQFRSSNVLQVTMQALASSGLEPSCLELELTEAVLLEKSANVLSTMTALRALGVGLAMDDFGTGYSSLSYLQNYPFSKIKIDGSFVQNLNTRTNSQAIVKAIIGIGHSLDMTVTAEGIEDMEVLDYLRAEGCTQGQGYFFAKAIPAAELTSETQRTSNKAA
ncbi:MAG: hypothetical protein JWL66_3012 [Sphingomonadales bacterium]|nr:hypothetical protein [Sphingomonadales bacterium]